MGPTNTGHLRFENISHFFRHFQLVHAGCSEALVEPMCPGDSCGSTSMALKVGPGGDPRLPEGAIGHRWP